MKSRRGLSSVVGMVFAIIALATTIAYVSYSMNVLSQYNNAVMNQNQVLLNSGKEKFQITSVTIPNGKFNITVTNTGNLPVNFTKLWIQNTTTTDWMKSYVPPNSLVVPGGTVTNIGQSNVGTIYTTKAYYVKLVTSRGTTQAFTVNSASTAPLNIQLLALPSVVPSAFTTELVMIVTNNGSSTLVNVTPNLPSQSGGSATCVLGTVSPSSFNTLPPGGTAVFKWDLTASTNNPPQTCTFTLTTPLQNGYPQSLSATVTVNLVQLATSNYAQYAGTLTMNFTSFRWTQGTSWTGGWTFQGSNPTAFAMNLTNNNATSDFYVSKYTLAGFHAVKSGGGGQNDVPFYIVNYTTPTLTVTAFGCGSPGDYCIKIPSKKTVTLYFSASSAGGGDVNSLGNTPQQWFNMMLLYGKFDTSRSGSGTSYGQDIPFLAIRST